MSTRVEDAILRRVPDTGPGLCSAGVMFPKDTNAVYTIHDCKRFLTGYIDKEGLVDPTNPAQLVSPLPRDTTPWRMTGMTLHSHVTYKEISARPLFSSVKRYSHTV